MLKLSSNALTPLGRITGSEIEIRRVTENPEAPSGGPVDYLLVRDGGAVPTGFGGYLFFNRPVNPPPANSFLLEPALNYLREGDIVRLNAGRNSLRTMYRRNSPHNALLVTERCNNFCLMCSQPPKEIDDSHLVGEILAAIPLMSPETREICLTGGEPSLLGHRLPEMIASLKRHLPQTGVHILSNGRGFRDWGLAESVGAIAHPDLMVGVPIYSDVSTLHDYVVQAAGGFDDAIRGIINLKNAGVRVEIRVVLHRQTYGRLPDLARFIRRNLTFCDHVALMGLEMTGFTKVNFEKLWIDPREYQPQLREAVGLLSAARMSVSIYNHQLCVLDPSLERFSRKSISDWKNEYLPACGDCVRKGECGGFFSSTLQSRSAHIKPFLAGPPPA